MVQHHHRAMHQLMHRLLMEDIPEEDIQEDTGDYTGEDLMVVALLVEEHPNPQPPRSHGEILVLYHQRKLKDLALITLCLVKAYTNL